jgi:hypothetical protein
MILVALGPDPEGQKLFTKKKKKSEENSCFDVPDVLI